MESKSTNVSLILALVFSILLFSGMQMYKSWFSTSQLNTLLGGYIGSWFFIFFLTAVSNLKTILFGKGSQTQIFPEILTCLMISMAICGTVHRVCATTCVLFSIIGLYFINRISSEGQSTTVQIETQTKKKRK